MMIVKGPRNTQSLVGDLSLVLIKRQAINYILLRLAFYHYKAEAS